MCCNDTDCLHVCSLSPRVHCQMHALTAVLCSDPYSSGLLNSTMHLISISLARCCMLFHCLFATHRNKLLHAAASIDNSTSKLAATEDRTLPDMPAACSCGSCSTVQYDAAQHHLPQFQSLLIPSWHMRFHLHAPPLPVQHPCNNSAHAHSHA
jgi:hypothetical protein